MAKIYGLFGSMTGKLADVVMTVRNGVQIARKYQPVVMNPQSAAQMAVRAKMKMLSQLSAAYATIIAIRRQGSVSARNIFTRLNFAFSDFDGSKAVIPLADVLLTNSTAGLPGMLVDRSSETEMSVTLDADASAAWDTVVYVCVAKTASQEVIPISSTVVREAGDDGRFPGILPYTDAAIAVYGYGVRYTSAAARIYFDNLMAPAAQDYAQVLTTNRLSENDIVVSETRGLYMEVGENSGATVGVRSVVISAYVGNQSLVAGPQLGTITGAGTFPTGATVTLQVTPVEGYQLIRWADTPGGETLGTDATLTFTAEESKNVCAILAPIG